MSKKYLWLIALFFLALGLGAWNGLSDRDGEKANSILIDNSDSTGVRTDSVAVGNEFVLDQNLKENDNKKIEGKTMKKLADFDKSLLKNLDVVTMKTNKGDIKIKMFGDKTPVTVLNFLTLAKDGFYDGIKFHRVIKAGPQSPEDFIIQAGDPYSKDESKKAMVGTGGPGYNIPDDFVDGLSHDKAGILSMANAGPNTGGSQFFITLSATAFLDNKHAVFGEVIEGMDIVNSIEVDDIIESIQF
jgi:cyclophilin family peptidyl-prolyl cis-trans isomerase